MPTPAQPAKAAATQLEPELLSKLRSLKSMSPAKRARAFKSLEKDVTVFVALILAKLPPVRGHRKDVRDSSRFAAKLVSQDLKGFSNVIAGAAARRDKQFFVDLG